DRAHRTQVSLDPQELMALRLSLTSGPFVEGSPVKRYAESAWRKISEATVWQGAEIAQKMERSHAVNVTAFPADVSEDVVETINRAVGLHHRLRVVYRSQKSRRVGEYTVDPYAVVFRRHSWYVVGYCKEHEKIVQFKLVRFLSAFETGETFSLPADFSVDEFFASSWEAWAGDEPVLVRVRFDPEVAEMISEVKRHPSQVVRPLPDGGIIFEVTVAGIEEIGAWIMGYGKHAVVLEPERLREYVFEHARAMAANHRPERTEPAPYESSVKQVARA
ncbi:MAG: helix-turn-helix transcriptional regulator, partial [Armatimonadota bacterium]